jgi:hypothetical protein
MLTNKLNLPKAVVLAVQNDPYTRGKSDISVTQLISPPYQRQLRTAVEPQEDVAERLFSLYGQIGHGILERAGLKLGSDVENRLFAEINGWTVSGQYDLFEDGVLMDYKFTTFWSVKGDEPKTEWVQQLNLLRVLAIRNGMDVKALRIIALLRDHQMTQAKRDPEYPQLPIATVDIPVWDVFDAEEFMLARVKAHQDANPPPCTDEERWMQPSVFALKKNGRKTAIKLYESREEAESAASAGGKDHFVEHRPGEFRRCTSYCNVAHGCQVFQQSQQTEF